MPSQPSSVPPARLLRSREYYIAEGDVIFKVENTIFRVHKYFFYRESPYFKQLFRAPIPCSDPPGSSETNPVVLEDTSSEAFSGLCWIFYNPEFSIYKATEAKWVDILALAQRWTFKEIEQLCIRELEKLPIAPIDKIQTYQAFHIDRTLLAESFAKLTIRPEPLNLEEGRKLGIDTSLQIAQAREAARGMNPNRQVNDTELRSVIQNVFGLEESVDFLTGAQQQPHHSPANETIGRKSKK